MSLPRRIAWFSPLRGAGVPDDSLSAYLSDMLLPILRSEIDIDVFQAERFHLKAPGVYHFLEAGRKHAAQPYDLFFYQVEDRHCSRFVRSSLGLMPGIVLFHDVLFTKPAAEALLQCPWRRVVRGYENPQELSWPYEIEWSLDDTPFGLREFAFSALPTFSNPWAHNAFLHLSGQDPDLRRINQVSCSGASYHVPLPFAPPVQGEKYLDAPLTLGIASACGIEGRSHKIFQALQEFSAPYRVIWLLNGEDELVRVKELADEFGIAVEFRSPRSPETWAVVTAECDLVFHLHHSVFGNLNPYVDISLASGVVVVLSDFGFATYVGGEKVIRIETGEREVAQISELLWGVFEQVLALRSEVATSASGGDVLSAGDVAEELFAMFARHASDLRNVGGRWTQVRESAANFIQHNLEDWYRRRFDLLQGVSGHEESEIYQALRSQEQDVLWKGVL